MISLTLVSSVGYHCQRQKAGSIPPHPLPGRLVERREDSGRVWTYIFPIVVDCSACNFIVDAISTN